jgi:hypothetical protein
MIPHGLASTLLKASAGIALVLVVLTGLTGLTGLTKAVAQVKGSLR